MPRWLALIALALHATASPAADWNRMAVPAGGFIALCYHEVRSDVRDYPDPFAVDDGALVAQFAWLRGNGYSPVSLEQVIVARQGGKPLPANAVLLTFDDAYLSFYTRVYPLLKEFNYPAVLGVVGAWIDRPQGGAAPYGEAGTVTTASFPAWGQLREMADSGLVELASHTYDLHRGIPANPQGNLEPAATTRAYDSATGRYEDEAGWHARVQADLARNAQAIERNTGRRPRAVVWPYGSYNDALVEMAAALGSPVALTLGDGVNSAAVPLHAVRRILLEHNPSLAEFVAEVRGPEYPAPLRVVEASVDDVYSADPAQQERNLSALLDRIQVLKPTHVYLKAYAADGAAYFPNRHVPVRTDLFNRVAWQLETRTDVKVFAMLPVGGFGLPRDALGDVYEDLARHASFDGLVFEPAPPGGDDAAQYFAGRVRSLRAPLTVARTIASSAEDKVVAHEPDYPGGARRLVVMLGSAGSRGTLAARMRALQLDGVLHFGYYPDDFLGNDPRLAEVAPAMSLRISPPQPRTGSP